MINIVQQFYSAKNYFFVYYCAISEVLQKQIQ